MYIFIFRFQNNYTEAEVEFFRLILKELATADGHSIDSIYALNMIGQVKVKHIGTKSFTKKRAQKIIAGWIRVGYLVEIGDRFWLGPKGIVEFGPFLRIHYADNVSECVLCKEPIFSVSFFSLYCVDELLFNARMNNFREQAVTNVER